MTLQTNISIARCVLLLIFFTAEVTDALADKTVTEPAYVQINVEGIATVQQELDILLPKNVDNSLKVANFGNKLLVNSDIEDLPMGFLDGVSGVYLTYTIASTGSEETITLEDNFTSDDVPTSISTYIKGLRLPNADSDNGGDFASNTTIEFHISKEGNILADSPQQRVVVFKLKEYKGVFVACEEGDDWDYRDKVFWFYQNGIEPVSPTSVILTDDNYNAYSPNVVIEGKGDKWYNINGLRVNGYPTMRGIYIYKGNKIIIN